MPRSNKELIAEFEEAREKCQSIFAKLVEQQVPGFIDPAALTCSCGESCGTGKSRVDPNLGMIAKVTDSSMFKR